MIMTPTEASSADLIRVLADRRRPKKILDRSQDSIGSAATSDG